MTTHPTIQAGATGPDVRWLQFLLAVTHATPLSDTDIDGVFGPKTTQAVKDYQSENHLTVDGIVGPATWGSLHGGDPEPPNLAQGSHGSVVSKLQTALNEGRGSFSSAAAPALVVDGDYGPRTADAVRGAQHLGSIHEDGVVGLQTWALPVHAAGQNLADVVGVR